MYNNHVHPGYRTLTTEEATAAKMAISWLASKHLKAQQIVMLTERDLRRESNLLEIELERGSLVFIRRIDYTGTDFHAYITGVLPYLKVEHWLFPNLAWAGRRPSFGFHLKAESVENYLESKRRKRLLYRKRYAKMKLSTKKSNIQKQITVGRRIALRA